MTMCKFFAKGSCRNGELCTFIHKPSTNTGNHLAPTAPVLFTTEKLNLNPAAVTYPNEEAKPAQNCHFFLQGRCNKGKECRYNHLPVILSPQHVHQEALSADLAQLRTDTRATVPCKFLLSPGGCRNDSCPYLHVADESNVEKTSSQFLEACDEQDAEHEDDFVRTLLGATVYFNEVGSVLKVSFPTDFSLVYITGLMSGATPEALVSILHGFGFNLTTECVRISKSMESSEPTATVKVEDPMFATELNSKLKIGRSALKATPININTQQTNCRKVYISWHKSTRSVWVNFGSGEIANRVADKFNKGLYKCMGQSVKSSLGKQSQNRGGRRGSFNPLAWTIVLSDVPGGATTRDIKAGIKSMNEKPRHVELGPISYQASDPVVSIAVRSCLEKYGPLESFYLAPINNGKRVKATALFVDESDAREACLLNNRPLDILVKGKLTVTIIQSAKIKVLTAIYIATKCEILMTSNTWKERHLRLHVYPDTLQRFTTLKIEGSSTQDIAHARKALDLILNGMVLMDGNNPVWDVSLSRNGSEYGRLKSIEKEFHIIIMRDKPKHQLRYYGPPEKFQQTVHQVTSMLKEESSMNYDMQQQHDTDITITTRTRGLKISPEQDIASRPEGMCPICLDDEPDTPLQTSCKHTYCLECFENCCKSAASTSKQEFRIECQGDGGDCTEVFNLAELKDHLSSSAFELVLKSSFEKYIQRHPKDFHYCPTPDCGYVYRRTSNSKPPLYTCPNCLESICTFCDARHGGYTCAEYKDIASGGYAAVEKLKKELNIKDCPKCKTSMEKTEGCNHMTCMGCMAHICWVCMAVFGSSSLCYDHMTQKHGGIGLDELNDLVNW